MEHSAELEVKLRRFTQHAKIIMWLSIVSIISPPLYLIVLIFFFIYNKNKSQLKQIQTLRDVFLNLASKTTKELKYIKEHSEPLEQSVASLLIAHKSMVTVLIVTGTILVIIISVIGIYSL